MATLDVIDLDKRKVGTIDLADALVNAPLDNADALFYETVKAFLASRRAGTHAVKNRSLVSGGGKKPWRQKGTGRARQGTTRAPQFSGGGHAFAKTPRSFVQKVNRKAQRSALRSALASHAQEGTIAIVDAGQFDAPSTKAALALVEQWGKQTPTVVVALPEEENLVKSFRNLERVAVIAPGELEVGAVVWARSLLVTEAALPLVQGRAS